ncbi:UbiA family prenyltransferase [Stackebrandtia nassauensis]|uniref:UbiA prenyltransferase n=1 Tax=Stackebrandtia nassauensis (strain DSM 44728 / CIP 108903 / NRRL B-16338 / NBRC 102104 / LLR-40K-21) TaxID=446470 RepID=D3Q1M0_STANL|nr:UbiA family prenyltransferase [Stackebrandtia nassauensis]ADD39868.1 UbiA prenyltransferase [Stackebrandtia nassauensis DSM 44728]
MKPPALIRACHPGPSMTVTLVGAGLAAASGRDAVSVASVFVAVLLGQLSIGWSNDALDAARDTETGRPDKPVAAGEVSRRLLFWLAGAAVVGSAAASLYVGWQGSLHILAVASAWSYNHPLKRTPLSVLPFAVSFGLLVGYADADPRPGMIAAGALLGAAAHFANVLPDLDDDARTGVRGLPHRLGARGSQLVAATLLAASGVIAGLHIVNVAGIAVMALSAVFAIVVLVSRPGRTVFRVVMAAAIVDVVALLAAVAT